MIPTLQTYRSCCNRFNWPEISGEEQSQLQAAFEQKLQENYGEQREEAICIARENILGGIDLAEKMQAILSEQLGSPLSLRKVIEINAQGSDSERFINTPDLVAGASLLEKTALLCFRQMIAAERSDLSPKEIAASTLLLGMEAVKVLLFEENEATVDDEAEPLLLDAHYRSCCTQFNWKIEEEDEAGDEAIALFQAAVEKKYGERKEFAMSQAERQILNRLLSAETIRPVLIRLFAQPLSLRRVIEINLQETDADNGRDTPDLVANASELEKGAFCYFKEKIASKRSDLPLKEVKTATLLLGMAVIQDLLGPQEVNFRRLLLLDLRDELQQFENVKAECLSDKGPFNEEENQQFLPIIESAIASHQRRIAEIEQENDLAGTL